MSCLEINMTGIEHLAGITKTCRRLVGAVCPLEALYKDDQGHRTRTRPQNFVIIGLSQRVRWFFELLCSCESQAIEPMNQLKKRTWGQNQ